MPNPSVLIDDALTLQLMRLGKALRAEEEQGRTLDTTSDVMRDYVNIIQAKQNIDDGQNVNINMKDSVSSWLDELEKQNNVQADTIEFDYDKEQRKDEIKKLRKEEFSNLLNNMD